MAQANGNGTADEKVIIVSCDTHIGPRVKDDLRPYCPTEHLELFEEGEEAEYFASDEEYRDKLRFYLANHTARDRIARAGHERCMSSGYSYDDRIRCVLSEIRS